MIKKILLLSIVFFATRQLQSQTKYSVFGGVNISMENSPVLSTELDVRAVYNSSGSGTNFYTGINTEFVLNPVLALELNLIYAQRGYNRYETSFRFGNIGQIVSELASTSIIRYKYQTIDLRPVVYYGLPLGTGKASIGIGPSISYRIKGTISTSNDYVDNRISRDTSFTNKMDNSYFSPGVQGVLKYEFGFGLLVHAGFNYLFDVQPGVTVSVIEFGIGYTHHFKRRVKK